MSVLFIVNERAGDGKGAVVWKKLQSEAVRQYPCYISEYKGHATELARQAVAGLTVPLLIIVIGGDGTVHEVLNGIIDHDLVTVGVVKAGSGNDFAREFGAFETMQDIERHLAEHSAGRRVVDCGLVQLGEKRNRYFANNSGFGLDADISLAAGESRLKHLLNKWKLGSLVYALTVVECLLKFKRFSATVHIDNVKKEFDDVWMITISNQKYYGGGMMISPASVYNDGKFEVTIVHSISLLKFLAVFLTVFKGTHTRFSGVEVYKGESFALETDREVGCHTDGEFIGASSCMTCHVHETPWYVAKMESDFPGE